MFDTLFLLLSYLLADNLLLFLMVHSWTPVPKPIFVPYFSCMCCWILLNVTLGPVFMLPSKGACRHQQPLSRTDKCFHIFSYFRKLTENLRNSFWYFPFQKPLFSLCTSNKSFGFFLYFLSLKLHLFVWIFSQKTVWIVRVTITHHCFLSLIFK